VASIDDEHHIKVFFFAPYIMVQKLPFKLLDIMCSYHTSMMFLFFSQSLHANIQLKTQHLYVIIHTSSLHLTMKDLFASYSIIK